MARIATELGQPLMPWQSLVADVALELLPDGRPAYRTVIVTVPRQQGKTTLVLAVEVDRALFWLPAPQKITYSAQTGLDGRAKLLEDQVPLLEGWPLYETVRAINRTMGSEGILFKNGSRLKVQASGEKAGHGRVIDLGVIDEAFADEDDRREQAMTPAMNTRPLAQTWILSTQGNDGSAYFNAKVDTGRAAVADDKTVGTAYFEWAADPDDDVANPATWWSCMPALGYTTTEDVVRHAFENMKEGEFRRAYLNQRTVAEERVIPRPVWDAVCSDDVIPEGELAFAVDVSPDRDRASIVVADPERRCELVDNGDGVAWLVSRVSELTDKWSAPVALDVRGPAVSLVRELEAKGVRVVQVGPAEMTAACGRLYDLVADGRLRVRRHAALDAAAAAARKRVAGDAWYWGRRAASTDITPLVALTLAVDLASTLTPPMVMWG